MILNIKTQFQFISMQSNESITQKKVSKKKSVSFNDHQESTFANSTETEKEVSSKDLDDIQEEPEIN